MKLLLALAVLCFSFLALSQVFGEELGPKDDLDYWTNGNQIQDEWLQSDPFREILRRMTRKPRPHQFIGLMGKRSSGHKINSFVGLMGKRSQEEPESYEWATLQNYEARR
uniref:Tachykinin domain-containing protein n=1 Tax=Pygocentrus nattereri TaxID=42514 RepID=A0AAR2KV78_PYGNA